MPLRRSFTQLSSRTARAAGRNAGSSVRGYATENSSRQKQQFTVWRPYLRLAIGVPFIGMIIYSMVSNVPPNGSIAHMCIC
jgi:coproporphyrinogen III oxidase